MSLTAAPDIAATIRASMERRVIVSAGLAHGATHALELVFAALLLRIGLEFGADLAVLGVVATVGTVTFGAFALPAGWLTDRLGPRAVMAGSMGTASVFAALVAAAPNLLLLAVALAFLGAAIGLYHPAGTAMVATVARRRGVALAVHGIAGNIGVAIAPVIAIGIAIAFDWRVAYLAFALAAAGVSVLIWRIAPSRQEAADAAAERLRISSGSKQAQRRTAPPAVRGWFTRPLLIIYASAIGSGFIYRGSLTFLPVHLEEHLGISIFGWDPEAVAGATATAVLMAAVFGQISGGWLSDRIPVERAILPYVLLTPPFLALMAPTAGYLLIAASAAFVLVNWAQQPILNGLITDYAPTGATGRAFGISFFLNFGIGSFSGSFTGIIADRWGTPAAFFTLAVIAVGVLAAMTIVALGAERRRAERDRAEAEAVGG